jgi:hypothetical protein
MIQKLRIHWLLSGDKWKKFNRLTLYNFLYILCLNFIYYETNLKDIPLYIVCFLTISYTWKLLYRLRVVHVVMMPANKSAPQPKWMSSRHRKGLPCRLRSMSWHGRLHNNPSKLHVMHAWEGHIYCSKKVVVHPRKTTQQVHRLNARDMPSSASSPLDTDGAETAAFINTQANTVLC